jgi:hypothetical protein
VTIRRIETNCENSVKRPNKVDETNRRLASSLGAWQQLRHAVLSATVAQQNVK